VLKWEYMKKQCFKCKRTKELKYFYTHKQMADGHLNKCKSCAKKDVQKRYDDPNNRKKITDYEKKRNKRPERKLNRLKYNRKRRLNNPGKIKARNAVNNAIRDGRLIKEPCEVCGNIKSEGHHPDHRSPLKVIWLCLKHHREHHGQKVTER